MTKALTVQRYMTPTPFTLAPTARLAEAHFLMKERQVRHLPVCEGEQVVGMLCDGDLFRAESPGGGDPSELLVREVMDRRIYTVGPGSSVEQAVLTMAGERLGSAVVVDAGRVVGIFTATDALKAFAEVIRSRPASEDLATVILTD